MEKDVKRGVPTEQPKEDAGRQLEALKRENEELRAKMAATPQDLEGRIQFFRMQEQNLRRLEKVQAVLQTLEQVKAGMELDKDELEGERYSLELKAPQQGYSSRSEGVIRIANPQTVAHLVGVILQQLRQREGELQAALTA